MNKAILVVDMPESCRDCMIRSLADDCQAIGRYVQEYRQNKNKPDWCPLKPMPEKEYPFFNMDEYEDGRIDGWNEFFDKIYT